MSAMTSNRPYLVRAIYDWIVDNGCTPHVVVDANYEGVLVPQHHVSDGQIVLNLAPRAVDQFSMDLKSIRFSTRFGGVPSDISFPIAAIVGIYARENGQGLMFSGEERSPDPPGGEPPAGTRSGNKPSLKVVK